MTATEGAWIDGHKIHVATETLTDGRGHTLTDRRGLFVVHAVLLHTGKVLWFCGHVEDGHYALKSYLFDYRHPAAQLVAQEFPLHNPALARGSAVLHAPGSTEFHADLFCCHFVHAVDGRIIVVGGSDPDYFAPGGVGAHGSVGERYVYAFDPVAEAWAVVQDGSNICRLAQGRWYPTAVALGDGRVAVFSGRREYPVGTGISPADVADTIEILTPGASGTYTATTVSDSTSIATPPPDLLLPLPIYPGLHLAPNGRIYYTHTTWGLEFPAQANTRSIEIAAGETKGTWTDHAGIHPAQTQREEGMSVLLPPAQDGKILLFGGSEAQNPTNAPVRVAGEPFARLAPGTDPKSSEVLDTSIPAWSAGPTLLHARINGHAVILPDKKVLIFGGHDAWKWGATFDTPPTNPSLHSELYDPASNTTTQMADLNHPRMYHSAAVLLPDGTVLVAGGADANEGELAVHGGPPDDFFYPGDWEGPRLGGGTAYNRKDYEIYHPTYLFTGDTQPIITAVKRDGATITQASYGSTITIETPQAASIDAVALIRPGAATHHTDSEQRYVALEPITPVDATSLTVALPINRNLAPPGYYMLWIVAGGKPCAEARFIQLIEPPPVPPPSPASSESSWCLVVTAAAGSRSAPDVRFLQGLRAELEASGAAGARFVAAVNALYYSVSPQIARTMRRHPPFRAAIRAVMVRPAIALIRSAEAAAGRRGPVLIATLAGMGTIGLLLSPLLTTLVAADTLRRTLVVRRRNRTKGLADE